MCTFLRTIYFVCKSRGKLRNNYSRFVDRVNYYCEICPDISAGGG